VRRLTWVQHHKRGLERRGARDRYKHAHRSAPLREAVFAQKRLRLPLCLPASFLPTGFRVTAVGPWPAVYLLNLIEPTLAFLRIGSQHASTPLWRSAISGTDGSNLICSKASGVPGCFVCASRRCLPSQFALSGSPLFNLRTGIRRSSYVRNTLSSASPTAISPPATTSA